jgi:hypothetical protein
MIYQANLWIHLSIRVVANDFCETPFDKASRAPAPLVGSALAVRSDHLLHLGSDRGDGSA